jgi:8-oxo-dGTP diphosphatase
MPRRIGKKHAPEPIAAVGAVVYRRDDQAGGLQVLLIKKRGGYWTLPKGKLQRDEPAPVAVAREVEEETGIVVSVAEALITVSYSILKARGRLPKQVTYYLAQAVGGDLRPDPRERIMRVRWVRVDEALRRIKRGRVRRAVQAAVDVLGQPLGSATQVAV